MRILVIGSGYVGLVTGACFAEMGHEVLCLDIDKKKIELLKKGNIPIYEPGLEEIVRRNIDAGRLFFTTDYYEGISFAKLFFIAVATPALSNGEADLTFVRQVARQIAAHMDKYSIVVNKSTVPIGTSEFVSNIIAEGLAERGIFLEFDVVSNPEFLKEGEAVHDFMKPDRIVIGTDSHRAAEVMKELYAPFNLNHERLLIMDPVSAEMTKYASNAMLASRISFMNEMAKLCEHFGADVTKVRKAVGADKRIGYAFLYPGVGYGGSCFPKDIKALKKLAQNNSLSTPILDAIEEVNEGQKRLLGQKMEAYFRDKGGLKDKKIAIWGLAFKPGTDDIREAPALTLIRTLLEKGAYLQLFDPVAMRNVKELLKKNPQVTFCENELVAAKGVDGIALMTEWKQFRFVDLEKVLKDMKGKAFFDGRNQYVAEEMARFGFDYFSVGHKPCYAEENVLAPF